MKKILTVVLSATVSVAAAQWSNTTNYFEDSLHMPVSSALLVQRNAIVLTSYPDNGFFVIWQDERNMAATKIDIYAQKYDKAGNRLWAADGIPIANGPNNQHYTFSSSQDYRSRSFAATDSAGGFYICYSDDSVSNYVWERATVQHVRSNGTLVFPGIGHVIARSSAANWPMSSQLIADGNKGFYLSYKYPTGNDYLYVYNYRDENGTLKFYGGGRVNENAIQTSVVGLCGIKTDVVYPGTSIIDYNIWYDGDGNCNVIIYQNGNTGVQGKMLAYNKVWRAKKDSRTTTYTRNTSGTACPIITTYQKGEVYLMYKIVTDYQRVTCGTVGGLLYTYTNYRLLSNGYQLIDEGAYDYNFPKGVTLTTTGNINVDLIAVTRRSYANNIVSDFTVRGYAYRSEKFDSIPFQRATFSNPEIGFNPIAPPLNKLNFFRDTLLGTANYYPDFSLAGGGRHIYAAGLMGSYGTRLVRLQHLELSKSGADSFTLAYNTNSAGPHQKMGAAIGSEVSTGFSGTNITYDLPLVTVSKKGKALFYIREYYRAARVSPIGFTTDLLWGAMGKPISNGVYKNSYYNLEEPVATLDSTGNSGFIAWRDNKFIPGNTGDNVFMRHLDNLDVFNYQPPVQQIKFLTNAYGSTPANPAVLFGTSYNFSTLDVYNPYGSNPGTSPIIDLYDDIYLGRVQAAVFQNIAAIRRYNTMPYLNRNYTIKTDSFPPGETLSMKLYFTKADFDALKSADVTIADPGYLAVIRQPNTSANANAPATYTPVAGEEIITTIAWDSLDGGYYLKFIASGTGNFFIRSMPITIVCNNGSTSFTSNKTGSSYQWMLNSGGIISILNNNGNYSGTNNVTLNINNVPASFDGNRYFCVIDNTVFSNNYNLLVGNAWTGTVSNAWENPANWGCGTVPDANSNVIINSGTVTVNSNAVCRSLKVGSGGKVTVATGFTITVTN